MTPVKELEMGAVFEWCGRPVRVIDWRISPSRFDRASKRRGRWLRCELPNGEIRELHYFDDESVQR